MQSRIMVGAKVDGKLPKQYQSVSGDCIYTTPPLYYSNQHLVLTGIYTPINYEEVETLLRCSLLRS